MTTKLFKGRIIILYRARQVGKTTLIRMIQDAYDGKSRLLDCDEPDIRQSPTNKTSTEYKELVGNNRLVLIDEAQRVKNIGLTLKLIVDHFPHSQIIATGSSSFELSNEVTEPLTGRKYEFWLYPFPIKELLQVNSFKEIERPIHARIIKGMVPEVVTNTEDSESILKNS